MRGRKGATVKTQSRDSAKTFLQQSVFVLLRQKNNTPPSSRTRYNGYENHVHSLSNIAN